MTHELWRVQLWLADELIEEHIAPAALAEQYANVIRLRIHGLAGRRLHCAPITSPGSHSIHLPSTPETGTRHPLSGGTGA